ncbi:MAG: hypothetical protein HDT20_03840 [Oscillibacter sp.]|nr:hypothetical protein [Oscillibacter sp.]
MNELQIFENPEFGSIRTVEIGGEPWFVGKDVARALGYKNPRQALSTNVDDEDRGVHSVDTPSGTQDMTIINESGLYSLILSSKLPGAKKFKRWVTSEVLPSIRKTGGYMAPAAEKTLADLTAAVELLTERLDAMMTQPVSLPAPPLALPGNEDQQTFGPSARKRWMRTASEKLDLLSAKLNHPHSVILSQIYKIMEEKWKVSLEEERLRAAEEQNLFSCSVLAAISYSEKLRDAFQAVVDFNLAPENRGW